MDTELWMEIRRLFLREKLKRKAIARRLQVDVKTVRRALRSEKPPDQSPRTRRRSLLDPHRDRIRALLDEHPGLSAVRIREELSRDGYSGGITILRDYLTTLEVRRARAFRKIAFAPGEAAQVDWGHCGVITEQGVRRRLSVFVMVLCHSRMLYASFTLSQSLDDLLRCHQEAFAYFGGCPVRVLYDNMRTVVLSRCEDHARLHPRFLEFAAHYLVKPVLCHPGEPQEKGRVERAVGYVKGNFLAGRTLPGLADLNAQLRAWLDEVANLRLHGATKRRPVELFREEKPLLAPLPVKPFDTRILRPVVVSPDCRVIFETNTYTVPPEHVGKRLVLRASAGEVRVFAGDRQVARHARCTGRGQDVIEPAHVQAVTRRSGRVAANVLLARLYTLGEVAKDYVKGLVERQVRLSLHVQRLVSLLDLYGREEVLRALEEAVSYGAYGCHYVQHLLIAARRRENLPPLLPLRFPGQPEIDALTLPDKDLADYDRFVEYEPKEM